MFTNQLKGFVLFLGVLFLFGSCTKIADVPSDPKQTLQDYISRSFSINRLSDKKSLEEFLSGEAKRRLAAWSDEQFKKAFAEKYGIKREELKKGIVDKIYNKEKVER